MSAGQAGCAICLQAIGPQELFLAANPEITLFKAMYKRITFFQDDDADHPLNNVGFGNVAEHEVQRNGDLIHFATHVMDLPALAVPSGLASGTIVYYTNAIGHAILDKVSWIVGGTELETLYGEWLEIWEELFGDQNKRLQEMIGKCLDVACLRDTATQDRRYYTPLLFSFCRNVGQSFELVALSHHQARIRIAYRTLVDMTIIDPVPTAATTCALVPNLACGGAITNQSINAFLMFDYVFLSKQERQQFALMNHEKLIEQVQFSGSQALQGGNGTGSANRIRLDFNNACKFYVWVIQQQAKIALKDWFNYEGLPVVTGGPAQDPLVMAKLTVNNLDRIGLKEGRYYRLVVPWYRCNKLPQRFIYIFSPAYFPGETQPSGWINNSRLDSMYLVLFLQQNLNNTVCRVYTYSYQIIRIIAGMMGQAFAA